MSEYKKYYMAKVEDSTIGDNSIIGDFSRIKNSILGEFVKIDRNTLVQKSKIGSYSYTGPFNMIFNTEIGKYTSISYGVTIGPPEHDYKRLTMHPFIYNSEYELLDDSKLIRNNKFDKTCKIGNDVWIGCNSTILRGVEIPNGCVIGANTVVTKSPEPYSIIVGCPGVMIKKRFSSEIVTKLEELKWWNWSKEKIRENSQLFISEEITIELLNKIKI